MQFLEESYKEISNIYSDQDQYARLKRTWCRERVTSLDVLSQSHRMELTHRGPIMDLDLDRQSKEYVLACSLDGVVAIYGDTGCGSGAGMDVLCSLTRESPGNHAYGIHAVCWYPVDMGMFVTGSKDKTVKIWDSNVLESVLTFELEGAVYGATMSEVVSAQHSLVAITGDMKHVTLGDVSSGSASHILSGHASAVWTCAWSSRSEWELLSGSVDGQVRLWDIRRPGSLHVFDMENSHIRSREYRIAEEDIHAHSSSVTGVSCVPGTGLFWLTTGNDGRAKLWDMDSKQHLLKHYEKRCSKTTFVRHVDFSEDGRFVFHPSEHVVHVFDVMSGRLVATLEGGHYAPVHCCVWDSIHQRLFSAGSDKAICIWGIESSQEDVDTWSDDDNVMMSSI